MKSSAWARAAASSISWSVASSRPNRMLSRTDAEQHRVLQQDGHVGAHGCDPEFPQVLAAHPDGPGAGVDHAQDQAGQGGLAGAGGAKDGEVLAGRDGEADPVQHRPFAVAGRDVVQDDVRAGAVQAAGVGSLGQVGLGFEQVRDALAGGGGTGDPAGLLGQVLQRLHARS
jgi:hypothetical protein